MGDKKQTNFTQTPAQQKAAAENARKAARDKADAAQTKAYTAQNEADIQAGKKKAQDIHPEVRGGQEHAATVEKKTKLLAAQSGNMDAIDKVIAEGD